MGRDVEAQQPKGKLVIGRVGLEMGAPGVALYLHSLLMDGRKLMNKVYGGWGVGSWMQGTHGRRFRGKR